MKKTSPIDEAAFPSRFLTDAEKYLLLYLIKVNEDVNTQYTIRWYQQIESSKVHEYHGENFLIFEESASIKEIPKGLYPLNTDLIYEDQGVSVLVYATAIKIEQEVLLDAFVIDRMDGEEMSFYPTSSTPFMVMRSGKRIGGADLTHIYKEND